MIDDSDLLIVKNNSNVETRMLKHETNMENSSFITLHIVDVILRTFSPLIVIFGTLANIVCMIIWGRQVRSSVMAMFLFVLSILDTIGLYSLPLWQTIQSWSHGNKSVSTDACLLTNCIYFFTQTCTAWTVVYIGFNCACRLCFKQQIIIRKKTAAIMILSTVSVSLLLSSEHIWVDLVEQSDLEIVAWVCKIKDPTTQLAQTQNKTMYKFNWDWVNRLTICFFPGTLILACLIALHIAQRNYNMDNENNTERRVHSMSLECKDSIKIFYYLGISFLISAVPLTIFKMMISGLHTAQLILAYTLLCIPLYCNFAFKLILFRMASAAFRQNFSVLLKTAFLLKPSGTFRALCKQPSFRFKRVHLLDETRVTMETEISMLPCQSSKDFKIEFHQSSKSLLQISET